MRNTPSAAATWAVLQTAQQFKSSHLIAVRRLLAQQAAQRFDLGERPVRDIGKRALLDLAVLAIGLAQQIGGRRAAVWDAIHVHDSRES